MAVIGITPSNRLTDYVESIRRAGGDPRVLSMDVPPTLDGLDGVLFTGGGDIDPAHYGDTRHPKTNEPDAARDAFELALAKLALASETPLLAVCRGLQVVNVAAGGTLTQDIPAQVNQALGHQVDSPPFAIAHEVWVRARRRRSTPGQQPPSPGRRQDRRRIHRLRDRARWRHRSDRAPREPFLYRGAVAPREFLADRRVPLAVRRIRESRRDSLAGSS